MLALLETSYIFVVVAVVAVVAVVVVVVVVVVVASFAQAIRRRTIHQRTSGLLAYSSSAHSPSNARTSGSMHLHHTIQHNTTPYHTIQCYAMQYSAMQCNAIYVYIVT